MVMRMIRIRYQQDRTVNTDLQLIARELSRGYEGAERPRLRS